MVIETAGEGTDTVFASVDYTLAANVETLILQGAPPRTAPATRLPTRCPATAATTCSTATPAPTSCTGGAGNDTYVVDVGQADGDTVIDFAGNGAAAGDVLLFVGYGPGATFTRATPPIGRSTTMARTWPGTVHLSLMNGAAIDASDFLFS